MWKILAIAHTILAPTVMGILVIVALVVPDDPTGTLIIYAAVAGFVLAFPVSWFVAKRMEGAFGKKEPTGG